MTTLTKFFLSIALMIFVAACDDTGQLQSKSGPAPTMTFAATEPSNQQILADGVYKGKIASAISTFVIKNGQPVSYTTPTPYVGKDVRLQKVAEGRYTIHVDQARLQLRNITANSFSGLWTLGSRSFSVTMVKQPESAAISTREAPD